MIKTIDENYKIIKSIKREIYLWKHDNHIYINIEIPVGKSVTSEKDDEFIEDIINGQFYNGIKSSIRNFENSELPLKYLNGQNIHIVNDSPLWIYGGFDNLSDDIYLDADVVSNIRTVSNAFLLGHEIGHKISKYKDVYDAYVAIARLFDISLEEYYESIQEIYADICGVIVSGQFSALRVPELTDAETYEYIKQRVLASAHRI